eukprot:CAMPEP_0168539382 /NCGR_PEP_ID=MMETSP0405-20121227/21797_1 /TAXON_ID=498012 /ORGANISM="Trichosphaerium sp, Strain Am-I-7 wt" /LENGTH=366 /DNA_ID=CAMNT_0008568939 /DNA_START=360 /DNA_END=1457 /DNA_ORIENTATION=-
MWFLIVKVLPIGDFAHPAYGFINVQSLVMVSSIFGISGIIFLVSWAAGFAVTAFTTKDSKKLKLTVIVMTVVVLLVATYSLSQTISAQRLFYQLPVEVSPGSQLKVTCLIGGGESKTEEVLKADPGIDLVLWSEETGYYNDVDELKNLQTIAKQYGSVIAPTYFNSTQSNNMAALISDNGDVLFTYKKRHPVPGVETSIKRGPGKVQSADTILGKIALAICFDFNFPDYIAKVSHDTDIFLQPSQTWGPIGKYHAKVNAMRSVEQGFLLIRCSSYGYSGVYNPDGSWSAFTPDKESGAYTFVVPRRFNRVFTLYSYIGDTFGWITVIFAFLYLGGLVFVPNSILKKLRYWTILSNTRDQYANINSD